MSASEHFAILIDRLEYYLTKEIEKNIYGTGDTCYAILYDRIVECIKARKAIEYEPYQCVEVLLENHGYNEEFINKFITKAHCCENNQFEEDIIISMREQLVIIIDILEHYLTKKVERNMFGFGDEYNSANYERLVECINARKEINYVPYQSVEMLLKDHGYNEEFINKFLSKV